MAKDTGPAKLLYKVEHDLRQILDDSVETDIREIDMFGSTFTIPVERRFGSLESVHSYLDQLTGLKSFYSEFGSISTPRVKEVTKNSSGAWNHPYYDDGVIYLAPHGGGVSSHLREVLVLHELSHHIVDEINRRGDTKLIGGHSSGFLNTFLSLISIAMDDPMFSNMFRFMLMESGAKL